ncbi:hypothetical protein B4113_2796 [Geobacillus sp. B4113_201601]|nr:hypothetical protein B4113_2796 [Geobacillus sp. B4113_201601]
MKQKQWKPYLSSILAAPWRRQCEFVERLVAQKSRVGCIR